MGFRINRKLPVLSAIVKVNRWWGHAPTPSEAERVPFEVACLCGQRHTGWRQSNHQMVPCTCGRRLFVLPLSPLPRVGARETQLPFPAVVVPPKRGMNPWLRPLIAAGITLVLVVGIFVIAIPLVVPSRSTERKSGSLASGAELEKQLAAGQKAIGDGDFAHAVESFDAALELGRRNPGSLSAGRSRELVQLRRQAGLMASWPGVRIELVLARAAAAGLADEDWKNLANRRRGQTVVFDGTVRRAATGRVHSQHPDVVQGQTFRLNLQSLKLLKHLPLDDEKRVILLARLVDVRREGPAVFLLELDPDSGVLVTDERVAKRCGFADDDPEVKGVLGRQSRWIAELPISSTP